MIKASTIVAIVKARTDKGVPFLIFEGFARDLSPQSNTDYRSDRSLYALLRSFMSKKHLIEYFLPLLCILQPYVFQIVYLVFD